MIFHEFLRSLPDKVRKRTFKHRRKLSLGSVRQAFTRNVCEVIMSRLSKEIVAGRQRASFLLAGGALGVSVSGALVVAIGVMLFEKPLFDILLGHNNVVPAGAGGPLALTLSPPDGKGAATTTLGPDLRAGQAPQCVVPADHWQTAETLGAWTLVSCVVAPGFEFNGFELAPQGWRPEV